MEHTDAFQQVLVAAYRNDVEQAQEVIWAAKEAGFEGDIERASRRALDELDTRYGDFAEWVHAEEFGDADG